MEVFDQAPAGVLVTRGEDHRLLYANDDVRAMFGDLPIGAPVRECLRDVLGQEILAVLDEVRETGETARLDEVRVTADRSGGPRERSYG
ncbi:PAS domain-containing protein [Microbispora sp. GKU 823]|uniref:PAS domain-containing protein n=1 Tax=Microbispora sp. GKU 823 TaxID=1652100 RepID=UPI002119ABB8|nr:PAS domain-containing protein [Microbispora sp. GKU 823]